MRVCVRVRVRARARDQGQWRNNSLGLFQGAYFEAYRKGPILPPWDSQNLFLTPKTYFWRRPLALYHVYVQTS